MTFAYAGQLAFFQDNLLEFCTAAAFQQLEVGIMRLVGLHGDGITHRNAVKLTLFLNGADGRYLLKGSGREVWDKYRLPSSWRRMQGRIYGKRCGTSQNLGPVALLQALRLQALRTRQ